MKQKYLSKALTLILLLFVSNNIIAARMLNGAATDRSWTSSSAVGTVNSGDYIEIDGAKITLGNATDQQTTWTWNAGNSGIIPSQMPSMDGTASTLITSFADVAPFGTLPERGGFMKIEATKDGSVIVNCKPSTDASQKLVLATVDSNNAQNITEVKIEAAIWNSSYELKVEAGKTYYFFQLSYPGKLTTYRFTLKGLSFSAEGEKPIKVFTIGDSTMANKTSATERGWGMLFPQFVDASLVTV